MASRAAVPRSASTGMPVPALDSAAVRDTLQAVIETYDLAGGLRPECYTLKAWPGQPPVSVTLREVHDARCGGDPNTAPRIVSFQ